MTFITRLWRDAHGASAVEMALTMPVLLLFVYGTFQLGAIFQANAGMQHALGEGARLATICNNPTSTGCTAPTDQSLIDKMTAKKFGAIVGTFNTPTVSTPAVSSCTHCKDLQVTYTVTPNFLLFSGPAITLTRNKRVYFAY
jgi:Flp pilus assembly protein TadG